MGCKTYVMVKGNVISLSVMDVCFLVNLNPLVLKKLYLGQPNEMIEPSLLIMSSPSRSKKQPLDILSSSLVPFQLLSRIASGYMEGGDWRMSCDLGTKERSLGPLTLLVPLALLTSKALSLVCLIAACPAAFHKV